MKRPIRAALIIVGCVALLAGTSAATFQSICRLSTGSSYVHSGPSYCHNAAVVYNHELFDCPCRAKGHVSATGPFACSFHSRIEWGGMFGGGVITNDAPVGMVLEYDIPLDCGEAYKVEMTCSCGARPRSTVFFDQGDCSGDCGEEDPDPPSGG